MFPNEDNYGCFTLGLISLLNVVNVEFSKLINKICDEPRNEYENLFNENEKNKLSYYKELYKVAYNRE